MPKWVEEAGLHYPRRCIFHLPIRFPLQAVFDGWYRVACGCSQMDSRNERAAVRIHGYSSSSGGAHSLTGTGEATAADDVDGAGCQRRPGDYVVQVQMRSDSFADAER